VSGNVVEVQRRHNTVAVYPNVSLPGAQGPTGPAGPAGPPGPEPTVSYVHTQSVPSDEWGIDHDLGWYPNATVLDSAGTVVEGEIEYESVDRIVLRFSSGFSGRAYLS
jgi:hypothetical protein